MVILNWKDIVRNLEKRGDISEHDQQSRIMHNEIYER